MEMLPVVASTLLTAIPSLAVDVLLLVLAMSRWTRHPRVSMLASASAVLMMTLDSLVRVFFATLPMKLRESGRSTAELGSIFAVVGGVSSVLHAIAIGLLVAAVFVDRGTPEREALLR